MKMSTLATVTGLVMGGGLVGAGLLIVLTGHMPDFPGPIRDAGAMFALPGLGLLLIQGMGHGSGVPALICGLAAFASFGWGTWLGFRYLPLVVARSRDRKRRAEPR
ncbi:hypothetical protein C6361_29875 [Plantactinospora sp. BC1]|nr:hypothetical protein C6361_29875 [Plantactinospora sp. BC1]